MNQLIFEVGGMHPGLIVVIVLMLYNFVKL